MQDIQEKQKKILDLEKVEIDLLKEKEKNEKLLKEQKDFKENYEKLMSKVKALELDWDNNKEII